MLILDINEREMVSFYTYIYIHGIQCTGPSSVESTQKQKETSRILSCKLSCGFLIYSV